MSSLLFLIFFFLYYAAFGKEKDIYHVITGEAETPLKRNLDPVYYVGVYDKKPLSLPSKYEIELMTADSGKRFTCIIPKDDGSANTNNETSKKGADSDSEETLITNNKQQTELESDTEIETETEEEEYMDDEAEPVKTTEELLQEADTLDNRDRYIQESIVHSQNLPNPAPNRKKTKSRNSHCYFSREGYWNYELCLYDKINQFHGIKNKRDPNIKLGDFTAYIDVSKILMNDEHYPYLYLKDIYGLPLFENTEKNFVHLLYTAGHHKRQSLVTLQCSKAYGKRSKDGIIKISEPKIHHYHFIFIYKAVCEYDNWLQREYNIYDDAASSLVEPVIENTAQSHTATDLLWEKGIDPSSDDISLLLSPLLDAAKQNQCLLLKQGWWTVEFCYGSFIRQIHLEAKKQTNKDGEIVQSVAEWDIKQEHVIGKWAVDAAITSASYMIHKNANDPQRTYASIVYDGGDECDVTKQGRKTEIQFRCALNERSSQLVKSREDPSCYYIAQVETPLLCQHPAFKIPSAPKHEIVCYPFDEKEFVEPASLMKQVADIEAETDEILRMVTTAAKLKYQEEEEEEQQEKQKGDDIAQGEEVKIENKIPPKLEL